jgi:hypothetical protein
MTCLSASIRFWNEQQQLLLLSTALGLYKPDSEDMMMGDFSMSEVVNLKNKIDNMKSGESIRLNPNERHFILASIDNPVLPSLGFSPIVIDHIYELVWELKNTFTFAN